MSSSQSFGFTRKIAITGIFLAAAVIVNQFRITIPIGGAPVMRISFAGPFLRFIAVLLGPVYGGVSAALSDVLSFMLNPTGGYIPALTLVEFCKGFMTALLWKNLRDFRFRFAHFWYPLACFAIGFLGVLNLYLLRFAPDSAYASRLLQIGARADYLSWGLIFVSIAALLVVSAAWFALKRISNVLFEEVLRLIICIGIPCLIATTLNTLILKAYYLLPDKALPFILLPRIIEEMFMVLFYTYALVGMLKLYGKIEGIRHEKSSPRL